MVFAIAALVFTTVTINGKNSEIHSHKQSIQKLERNYADLERRTRQIEQDYRLKNEELEAVRKDQESKQTEIERLKRELQTKIQLRNQPSMVQVAYSPVGGGWAALRDCEAGSSGGYAANTGNGYYGAYQFDLRTWQSVGGTGYPHQAPPQEQDMRAQRLYQQRGAAPWPNCGRHIS